MTTLSTHEAINRWFTTRGFTQAAFTNGKARTTTGSGDALVVFRLRERPGSNTWYKPVDQGGLIVFEVAVTEQGIRYEGYCPLLVFGVWERKLAFKEKAGGIFAYRAEGWRIAQALRAELERR